MSAADFGEEYWADLAAEQEFLDPDADDAWAHENEEFVDEGDDESTSGASNLITDGSFGLSFAPVSDAQADNNPPDDADFDAAEVSFHQKNSTFTHVTNIVF